MRAAGKKSKSFNPEPLLLLRILKAMALLCFPLFLSHLQI
ncbi:MAG: hypothetical protein OP8BY_0367 [Candidatus Saccharicenans subterraneus]|uniref:Uncharacterized protein n=1 Tax=Candidatus Saccharicenans subterraneus TaxID=2508984 RepID=A0A3E2BLG5_9BACT|nr:MAG: hypothetical protein OP8BY_0367 [Candidatus Saccharicenans subterraneum]